MKKAFAGILRPLDPDRSCAEIAGAAAAIIGRHRREGLRQAPQIDEAFRQIRDFVERLGGRQEGRAALRGPS